MNFLSLISVELKKIKRSKILLILLAATIILWLPSTFNAGMNFEMQAEGISPEHNFFIQGFLALTWFMLPAGMVVSTVLICMTERSNKGILKMLSLPVSPALLCLAKFVVLMILAALQILMTVGIYYICAVIAAGTQDYHFVLQPLFVLKEAGMIFASSIPMLAFFWMLSVCIQTPVFSIGLGLASIVPSVLMINTDIWFAYPMSYPFFVVTAEYGKLAANLTTIQVELVPWLPAAALITACCLLVACLRFGKAERR